MPDQAHPPSWTRQVHPPDQAGTPPSGRYPPGRYTPGRYTPSGRYPPGRYSPPAGTSPSRYTPDRYTPQQVHPLQQVHTPLAGTPPLQVHPPGRYPQAGTPSQVHPRAGTPPGRYTPLWQVHPPGRYTPWAGTPLRAGTPLGRYTPQAGTPPGRYTPLWQVHPLGRYTPAPETADPGIRSTIGRYASYWNAFLFLILPSPAGIAPVRSYIIGKQKEAAQEEYRKQCNVFRKNKVDMVLGEVPIEFSIVMLSVLSVCPSG